MDYILIFKVLFGISIFWMLHGRFCAYSNLKHEKELLQRGYFVKGKVEKKTWGPTKSVQKPYAYVPIVSFEWRGTRHRLETITTVAYKEYTKGTEVELLYLPEYPKKVIIKNGVPSSKLGFIWDTAVTIFCIAVTIYVIIIM